jgi:hypothetical protein
VKKWAKELMPIVKEIDLGKTININSIKAPINSMKQMLRDDYEQIVFETELLGESLGSAFEMIGSGIADALTGKGLKSILDGFINIISDFSTNLGKQLIAIGIAGTALKLVFKNPAGAIIAGIGLIALGAMIRKTQENTPKFAKGGIVGGYSFSGDRVPILANSGEMILNSAQQSRMFNQNNNGSGVLSARVSGNDLLFILENTKKKQSYSY